MEVEKKNMNDTNNEFRPDYTPFFKTIERKDISQNELVRNYGVCSDMLYRLRHNENMTMSSILHIMKALDIRDIRDVVSIVTDRQ